MKKILKTLFVISMFALLSGCVTREKTPVYIVEFPDGTFGAADSGALSSLPQGTKIIEVRK